MVPALEQARVLEAWAGLRPGTPDALPILGATGTPGYFVATGHFRDESCSRRSLLTSWHK